MKTGIAALLVCLASPAMADDASEVRALAEAFVRAWDRGDVKGALALYTDDARVVWPGQGDEARGKPAIEALLTRTFKALPRSGLVIQDVDVVRLGGGFLANAGTWDQTVPGPDGTPVTYRVRTTEVLRRQRGGLVYVVDHASIGLPPAPAALAAAGEAKPTATVVLENDRVRVKDVTFPAGVADPPMHTHDLPHVGVILTPGRLVFTEPGKAPETVTFDPGSVGYRGADVTHGVANPGPGPMRVIEVELK
ncbi:MAG TPA: SgcJ/EcaC family oxidoreductase [Vicinamibacteria bacterium]|nr:SgcJ/EcaC family oxidoreductase [Vicinamibacteria bacterium]